MTPQTPKLHSAWTALKVFLAGLCVFVACARTPEAPPPILLKLGNSAGPLVGVAGLPQAALRWPQFAVKIPANRSSVIFTSLSAQPGDALLELSAAPPSWDALTRTLSVSVTLRNTSTSETYRNLRGLLESFAPQGTSLPQPSGLNAQSVPFVDLGTLEPDAALVQTWRVILPKDEDSGFQVRLERQDASLVLSTVTPSGAYNDLDTVVTLRGKGFTPETQFFLGDLRLEVKSSAPGEVKLLIPRGTPPAPGGLRAVAPDGSRSSLAGFSLSAPGEAQRGRYTLRVSDDFSGVTVDAQGGGANAPVITAGKPTWDPATHTFSVDLTLTNPSGGTALPGLRGVLEGLTPNNVSLTLPSGFTAQQAAFLDLGALAPGASVTRTWRFSSPENKAFSATLILERFDDALSVQYAEPASLLNDQDRILTLTGRGFRAETRFFIESTALEVLSWTPGKVTLLVPRGFLPSSYGIMAVNPEGTRTVLYPALSVQNPPAPVVNPPDPMQPDPTPSGPVGKIGLRSFFEGYVYDFKTKAPLQDAKVFVSQCEAQSQTSCAVSAGESGQFQRFEAVTDSTGYYFLRGVPSGRNVVRIEKDGYEALYRIAQNSGEARTVALKLAELEPRSPGKTRIGASGGIHYANNGSFLKIPPGALEQDTDIEFTQLENANTLPELPQNGYFLAFARLGPVGLTFKKPATLFLPLEPGAVLPVGTPIRISYYDVRTAKWIVDITSGVISSVNGRLYLEYEINHFTWIGGSWNPRPVTGRIVFDDGTPAAGIVTNYGTTDADGRFTDTNTAYTTGIDIKLIITDPLARGIEPTAYDDGTNGTDFGTITLPTPASPVVSTPTVITTDGVGPCSLPGGISAQSRNPFSKFSALESAVNSSAPSGLGLAQSNILQAQSTEAPDVSIFFRPQIQGFGVNIPRYSRQKLDLSKMSFKWQGQDITEKSVMAVDGNEQLSFTHKTGVENYGAKLPLELSATNKKGNLTNRKRDIAVIDKIVSYKPKFVTLDDQFVAEDVQTPYALKGNDASNSQIVVLRKSDLKKYYVGRIPLTARAIDDKGQTVPVTSSSRFGYGSAYNGNDVSSSFVDGYASPPTILYASNGTLSGTPTETPYIKNPDPTFISSSSSGNLSAQSALAPQSCGGGYGYGYGGGTPAYIPPDRITPGGEPIEPDLPSPLTVDYGECGTNTGLAAASLSKLSATAQTSRGLGGRSLEKTLLIGPRMAGSKILVQFGWNVWSNSIELVVGGQKVPARVYVTNIEGEFLTYAIVPYGAFPSGLDSKISVRYSVVGSGGTLFEQQIGRADIVNSFTASNYTVAVVPDDANTSFLSRSDRVGDTEGVILPIRQKDLIGNMGRIAVPVEARDDRGNILPIALNTDVAVGNGKSEKILFKDGKGYVPLEVLVPDKGEDKVTEVEFTILDGQVAGGSAKQFRSKLPPPCKIVYTVKTKVVVKSREWYDTVGDWFTWAADGVVKVGEVAIGFVPIVGNGIDCVKQFVNVLSGSNVDLVEAEIGCIGMSVESILIASAQVVTAEEVTGVLKALKVINRVSRSVDGALSKFIEKYILDFVNGVISPKQFIFALDNLFKPYKQLFDELGVNGVKRAENIIRKLGSLCGRSRIGFSTQSVDDCGVEQAIKIFSEAMTNVRLLAQKVSLDEFTTALSKVSGTPGLGVKDGPLYRLGISSNVEASWLEIRSTADLLDAGHIVPRVSFSEKAAGTSAQIDIEFIAGSIYAGFPKGTRFYEDIKSVLSFTDPAKVLIQKDQGSRLAKIAADKGVIPVWKIVDTSNLNLDLVDNLLKKGIVLVDRFGNLVKVPNL